MAKLVETTYGEALFELAVQESKVDELCDCLLYTSPSPRD